MSEFSGPTDMLAQPAASISNDLFEQRLVRAKDGDITFKVLVVDSPEKWVEAQAITSSYSMPIPGSSKVMKFSLRGISAAQWEEVERRHIITEEKEGEADEDRNKRSYAIAARRVELFEISTGNKMPGKNIDDKVHWLQKLNPGEIDTLYVELRHRVCNMASTYDDLALRYDIATRETEAQQETIEITDFSDWERASQTISHFRMNRPTEDFIVEFPLKGISQARKEEIENETREPQPPKLLVRGPDGRIDPSRAEPNRSDPAWLQNVRVLTQKRIAMLLDDCLVFRIPGDSYKEKYDWISKRLVGDIIKLRTFIEQDLLSYRSQFDFFTLN